MKQKRPYFLLVRRLFKNRLNVEDSLENEAHPSSD